ncbi:MAG: endonuclease/exonuclease/phosphatase family protein [Bacteroidales bacterium]|nr:endonuclease/exonuclease/phosphatase family protein [Bacteroidales bacterium]
MLFFVLLSWTVAGQTSLQVRVLTFNIEAGAVASLDELAQFIREQAPDVVALQEVDCHTARAKVPANRNKDFITELGQKSGMLAAYGKTIPLGTGYYGIGILSRFPMSKIERVYLPNLGGEQRAVLIADIEYADNRYFTFACTHLQHTSAKERLAQVDTLNKILQNRPCPTLLCGDFNARPDATEIKSGMKLWKKLCSDTPTHPSDNPKAKIDYIFGFPADRWITNQPLNWQVILSDHCPIGAIVEMKY